MASAIYGDGSDGSVTFSSNSTISGVKQYTDFTIQSGVTVSAGSSCLVVHAQNSIQIDGTLSAYGNGASGGFGGSGGAVGGSGGGGNDGSDGDYEGAGGMGGDGFETYSPNQTPGAGGSDLGNPPSATTSSPFESDNYLGDDSEWTAIYNSNIVAGAGGGGGAGGDGDNDGAGADGGNGGDGGGVIVLIAPTITVNGTVTVSGANGQDGGTSVAGGDGGGGGGGAGGTAWTITEGTHPTVDVSGGAGGSGYDAGSAGASGSAYQIDVVIGAPNNLTATQGTEDQIDLSWDAVDAASEYRIYRALSSGTTKSDYTQIATVQSGTLSYTDTGLSDGEKYFYRVTAAG